MMSSGASTTLLRRGSRHGHGRARREWLGRILPLALFALIIQVLAPVATSAIAASIISRVASGASIDLSICHSDVEAAAAQSDGGTDQPSCALDCIMCCVLHASAALDAPPVRTHAAPLLRIARVDWARRELRLIHVVAWSQARPRGPPLRS